MLSFCDDEGLLAFIRTSLRKIKFLRQSAISYSIYFEAVSSILNWSTRNGLVKRNTLIIECKILHDTNFEEIANVIRTICWEANRRLYVSEMKVESQQHRSN